MKICGNALDEFVLIINTAEMRLVIKGFFRKPFPANFSQQYLRNLVMIKYVEQVYFRVFIPRTLMYYFISYPKGCLCRPIQT